MKMGALDSILRARNPDLVCVTSLCNVWTAHDLCCKAEELRNSCSVVKGKRIALYCLSSLELITALIAFDGYASAMLLLPMQEDSNTGANLMAVADCDYALHSNAVLKSLSGNQLPSKADEPSQWLLATSGTTGTPKLITHNLASLTRTLKRNTERGSEFVWGLMYEPARFAGLQVVLQALVGGSVLNISSKYEFDEQIKAVLGGGVNALSATPSLWRKILMDGRIKDLKFRQITLGGEIVDQKLINALRSTYPSARITHIYASTEAGAGFSVQDGLAGFPSEWIGTLDAPVQLQIDSNNHLLIKPSIMPRGDEIHCRLSAEGYLDTQDIVTVSKGRVTFLGRASGVINVGGNKVSPEEIEVVIREVKGVTDAGVFGKSSGILGQIVCAELVIDKSENADSILQAVRSHCLSELVPWKRPAIFRIVEALEETSAGKRRRIG